MGAGMSEPAGMIDEAMEFDVAGRTERASFSFHRGDGAAFHPNDTAFHGKGIVGELVRGLVPAKPIINKKTSIVAFGSCFADNVSHYLHEAGYNVATKQDSVAHISRFGDGIVNTFAVLQQFQWAWEKKRPTQELWHGYDAKAHGYDEDIRVATRRMLDKTDVFIITLGLSEIWYDEPTGEVFWRAVPSDKFDAKRHKFRVASQYENLQNLHLIVGRIRRYRPEAKIIFTLSPIPLTATFRPMSCIVASSASKANLRSALDEFMSLKIDDKVFYFPSYELVLNCFHNQFMEDRRHVHYHIIQFVMAVFERYFCGGPTDLQVYDKFVITRQLDKYIQEQGHWAVPRKNLKWSKPNAA
jgi:hypothetical protein